MSTSLLYHAFGIRGYQYVRTDYQGGQTIFTIRQEPKTYRCSACGSAHVRSRGRVERRFRALPIGPKPTSLEGLSKTPDLLRAGKGTFLGKRKGDIRQFGRPFSGGANRFEN